MNLDPLLMLDWQIISQVVQTLVVILGLVFVIKQIRQQTEAVRLQTQAIKIQAESFGLSTYMEMMAEGSRINQMAIEDPELAEFYDEKGLPTDLGNAWDKIAGKYRKFYLYLGRTLSLMERAFTLRKGGWMDDLDYRATLTQLEEVMGLRIFELWWPAMKPYYRLDFATHVESLRGKRGESFFDLAVSKDG